jgi:FkbM family methyltransferase
VAKTGSVARWLAQRLLYVNRLLLSYTELFGWRRGVVLLYRRVLPRGRPVESVQFAWPGYAQPFEIRNCKNDLATFTHVIVGRGYEMPFESAPECIVDLGANIGLASVWFATRFPGSSVLAVEPDPANFELLLANTRSYPNVTAVQAALWTECGKVELTDPGTGPDGYRLGSQTPEHADAGAQRSTVVNAIDLPTLMADHGIDRIGILKVDIEGAEREVFDASAAWIDSVDSIAIELHDRFKSGCSRAFFAATEGFPNEFARGEDLFVWRNSLSLFSA